ncbi:PRC-barrel domain-containing protein [Haladaptatus sp. CMAA 1911]|uniref:PRC-barrel domain-containing protein n=1 Tax=unclassified Haladaptatus TaxID=2622732 RepID=UPI003755041C
MTEIFAMNLIGKTVVGTQGTIVGEVSDITTNPKAGTILNFLIIPDSKVDREEIEMVPDEEGFFQLSVEHVCAIQDNIVVEL